MRICFVNDFFLKDPSATITGPMVQTYLLATGLARRGWTVDYVATTRSDRAGTSESHDGVTVHLVRASERWELGGALRIQRHLRAIREDVFYQRGRSALTGVAARAARACGGKFVWASSGESGVRRRKYLGQQLAKKKGWKRLLHWPIYARADRLYESGIEAADLVLVQTETQREELRKEFRRDSVVFRSGHPSPPESVLHKPQPPVVLWIGAIKPAKQPQMFLDLAAKCRDSDARFVLVGRVEDPKWRTTLAAAARNHPKFSHRDEVPFDQVSAVYAEASVLVNTTVPDYEGLPNAFIQAWLHGVPVVSLHSNPDGILEREGIGYYAGTFEGIVDRVKHLLLHTTEREAMGRKARAVAEKQFGIERILDEFERLISNTPAAPPRPQTGRC